MEDSKSTFCGSSVCCRQQMPKLVFFCLSISGNLELIIAVIHVLNTWLKYYASATAQKIIHIEAAACVLAKWYINFLSCILTIQPQL